MAIKTKCPACGNTFHVSYGSQLETCYACNTMFNPKKQSGIPDD